VARSGGEGGLGVREIRGDLLGMQHIHEGEATRPDGERGIQQGEGPGVVHPPRVATAPGDADGGDDCVGPVRDTGEAPIILLEWGLGGKCTQESRCGALRRSEPV